MSHSKTIQALRRRPAPDQAAAQELLPGLWRFNDDCGVYVVCAAGESIAIDFGSGHWLQAHRRLGLPLLRHVYLTHHHVDQCSGLSRRQSHPFEIHAPAGEERFLSLGGVAEFWATRRGGPVPTSYSVLPRGLSRAVSYDVAGFTDHYWGRRRIRFIHTPGHGPNAVSILVDHAGKQVLFCGDAAHAGGTIWQPYSIEWDHWTAGGAMAAFEGVRRLVSLRVDLLCPSHGPVTRGAAAAASTLRRLQKRLLAFAKVKGSICAGEPDRHVALEPLGPRLRRVLPSLYQFGTNGYLLISRSGQALVVDPYREDLPALDELLGLMPGVRPTALAVTHYHSDHIDGATLLQRRFGARLWLHPRVEEILNRRAEADVPFRPQTKIRADGLWPQSGAWTWNEYRFAVAPFAGQTWWHCAFLTTIDKERVMFAGDNFQPPSRWNGTGGFCAFNGSRFRQGFKRSARLAMQWRPELLANGHGVVMRFSPSYFRKVIAWSRRAERATRELCPNGRIDSEYDLHPTG